MTRPVQAAASKLANELYRGVDLPSAQVRSGCGGAGVQVGLGGALRGVGGAGESVHVFPPHSNQVQVAEE